MSEERCHICDSPATIYHACEFDDLVYAFCSKQHLDVHVHISHGT